MEGEFQIGPQENAKRISHNEAQKTQKRFLRVCPTSFVTLVPFRGPILSLWLRRERGGLRRLVRRRGRDWPRRSRLLRNKVGKRVFLLPE